VHARARARKGLAKITRRCARRRAHQEPRAQRVRAAAAVVCYHLWQLRDQPAACAARRRADRLSQQAAPRCAGTLRGRPPRARRRSRGPARRRARRGACTGSRQTRSAPAQHKPRKRGTRCDAQLSPARAAPHIARARAHPQHRARLAAHAAVHGVSHEAHTLRARDWPICARSRARRCATLAAFLRSWTLICRRGCETQRCLRAARLQTER
jgi:hypothetical protein